MFPFKSVLTFKMYVPTWTNLNLQKKLFNYWYLDCWKSPYLAQYSTVFSKEPWKEKKISRKYSISLHFCEKRKWILIKKTERTLSSQRHKHLVCSLCCSVFLIPTLRIVVRGRTHLSSLVPSYLRLWTCILVIILLTMSL